MSRANSLRTNSISELRMKNPRIISKPCHFSKSTFNFLVANMATADMAYLTGLPFILLQHVTRSWVFGRIPCKFFQGLDKGFFISCPYFMVLIAVDRLLTIYNAQVYAKNGKTWIFARVGITFTWLIFFFNFWINFYMTEMSVSENGGANRTICTIDYEPTFGRYVNVSPEEIRAKTLELMVEMNDEQMSRINETTVEGVIKHTRLSQYYTIYIILVAFIIPSVSAILSYGILISKMAKFEKQRQPVTRSSSDTATKPGTLNYSKTIYRRATWVVSIFMFTLAPYIALNYINDFHHDLTHDLEKTWPTFMYTIHMFCQFSAQFNQIFGPTLYAYNNPKFQIGFKAYINYLVTVCINKNDRNRSNSLRSQNTIVTSLPASTRNTTIKTPQ